MQMKRILLLLLPTLFAGAVRAETPRFADRMPAAPAATAATAAIPAATPAATPETESAAERLERERERLTREVAPLSAAAEAFRQASGKKPDKRQIPALLAENARLEKELEYSIKDQHGLYTELQASEKENAALKRDADTLRTLRTHAPDKLQEAMDTAKRRQESKRRPSAATHPHGQNSSLQFHISTTEY